MKRITLMVLCFFATFAMQAQTNGTSGASISPSTIPQPAEQSQSLALANNSSRMASNVLLLEGFGNPAWVGDVTSKLTAAGIPTVDVFNIDSGNPSLAMLQMYDAVILAPDGAPTDPAGLSTVLGQFVDGGGNVLEMVFAFSNVSAFQTNYSLLPTATFGNVGNLTLGTVFDPAHPTMQGVASFNNGTSGYGVDGTPRVGSTLIAEYSNGRPLVVVQDNYGASGTARMAVLNFFPPSTDAPSQAGFWDASTDGVALMANTLNWLAGSATAPVTECATDTPKPIPAVGTSGPMTPSPIAVAETGIVGTAPGEYTIESVSLDLNHTFDSDLDITLVSPDGTTLDLSSDNGGAGDNYTGTIFMDGAPSITTGSAPFTGTFQAEGGTFESTFAGDNVNGNWTLEIIDDTGGDSGTLLDWCITVSQNPISPIIACPSDVVANTDPGVCGA
ncbi:MAG: proprotein convertase P-domain-containing protein, partial [Flavobacteriales bacterium]|nr:proprotein convertase P-domain-containing protein [Flavobacteriales bacterium]